MKVHVQDVLAAVDAIKQLSAVDQDKIAMIGFSKRATVSLLTAIRSPELKALVIMAGWAQHLQKRGAIICRSLTHLSFYSWQKTMTVQSIMQEE